MNRIAIVFLALLTISCSREASPLEGVWQSNRSLTLENLNRETFDPYLLEFLDENLGKLFISFRGRNTKIFFDDIPESEMKDNTFKILEDTDKSIIIAVKTHWFSEQQKVEYHWVGECFYMESKKDGYKEYFCKTNT